MFKKKVKMGVMDTKDMKPKAPKKAKKVKKGKAMGKPVKGFTKGVMFQKKA